ncbi:hypothetical protein V8C37DRAFT_407811 [Trichoderma ceciliae]
MQSAHRLAARLPLGVVRGPSVSAPRLSLSVGTPVFRRHVASTTETCCPQPKHPLPPPPPPPSVPSRQDRIRDAKPFSDFLTDTFHRQHDYLRISISERCNLRCLYCMPEEGVSLSPDRNLLTSPEIVLLSSIFMSQGVSQIQLTRGEPTIRQDILPLMHQLRALRPYRLQELCITTNSISLHQKLNSMIETGLTSQFQIMTRRKGFKAVLKSIDRILELNSLGARVKLKINYIIMHGLNNQEIIPFIKLTYKKDLKVYNEKNNTSKTWRVPRFAGRLSFITSITHNFCSTCNQLRITSDGNLKVCLFGNAEVSLQDVLRESNGGEPIDEEAFEAMKQLEMNRRQGLASASKLPLGAAPNEAELLDVIGTAVKRKKAKHAGIGELEHMKNRPMILIDPVPSTLVNMPPGVRHLASRDMVSSKVSPTATSGCFGQQLRRLCSSRALRNDKKGDENPARLTHVSESGSAHMVNVSGKEVTSRVATAACAVQFSNDVAIKLIQENQMKKGDVLGVARVAGIMAAKRTADLIPLCHPIAISRVSVDLDVAGSHRIEIRATVWCDGKTGVEMEALTAASSAALTVYDMCKAVDKGMMIEGLRVVLKDGGKSGRWEMP